MNVNGAQEIALLDTSIATANIGDAIIMESVKSVVRALFPEAFFYHMPLFECLGEQSRGFIERIELTFVGGTPALAAKHSRRKRGWRMGLRDGLWLSDLILLGVGWKRRQGPPRRRTRWLYHRVLSKRHLHAVRDSHAAEELRRMGFENVLNTACPTMWDLTPAHCAAITVEPSEAVVCTLNSGHREPAVDRRALELLCARYETVWFFPQEHADLSYLRSLGLAGRMRILSPDLGAFDALLRAGEVDYVGMRLHGGIRALQHGVRTVILSVDHRAQVMAADTNLPVLERAAVDAIERWIARSDPIEVRLPMEAITRWQAQFAAQRERVVERRGSDGS